MVVRKVLLGAGVAIASAATVLISSASAQEVPETVWEASERFAFENAGDYFRNRTLAGQLSYLVGIGGFPELALERDGNNIHNFYTVVMAEQTISDPFLRVPDLPNPYNTSVLLAPSSVGNRVVGSELVFERLPLP